MRTTEPWPTGPMPDKRVTTHAGMASAEAAMASAETAVASAGCVPAALGTHRDQRNYEEERREGQKATHTDIIRPFSQAKIAEVEPISSCPSSERLSWASA